VITGGPRKDRDAVSKSGKPWGEPSKIRTAIDVKGAKRCGNGKGEQGVGGSRKVKGISFRRSRRKRVLRRKPGDGGRMLNTKKVGSMEEIWRGWEKREDVRIIPRVTS